MPIEDDPNALKGGEPLLHHLLGRFEEGHEAIFLADDLYYERQVRG